MNDRKTSSIRADIYSNFGGAGTPPSAHRAVASGAGNFDHRPGGNCSRLTFHPSDTQYLQSAADAPRREARTAGSEERAQPGLFVKAREHTHERARAHTQYFSNKLVCECNISSVMHERRGSPDTARNSVGRTTWQQKNILHSKRIGKTRC